MTEITVSEANVYAAVEQYLKSMKLIANDRVVIGVVPSGTHPHYEVLLRQEVSE